MSHQDLAGEPGTVRELVSRPPISSQVVNPNGQVQFTGADVIAGQEVFLRNGLMEYGSIFGRGAYLGPDFTADYLHRAALIVTEHYRGSSPEAAKQQTIADFKTNRYDSITFYDPSVCRNPHEATDLNQVFSEGAGCSSPISRGFRRSNLAYVSPWHGCV